MKSIHSSYQRVRLEILINKLVTSTSTDDLIGKQLSLCFRLFSLYMHQWRFVSFTAVPCSWAIVQYTFSYFKIYIWGLIVGSSKYEPVISIVSVR